MVDILSCIYTSNARYSEVILSKGHCVLAWLAVLKNIGHISSAQFDSYYESRGLFGGHPKKGVIPAITWSTGSLGHGLSVACGKAYAKRDKPIVCILGDGETNEGSVWEGLMFLHQHRLSNVLVIIDNNKKESLDITNNILGIEKFVKSLKQTNFQIREVNGHDHDILTQELDQFINNHTEPDSRVTIILADTVKGKGVTFMETDAKWHHRKLLLSELTDALQEIGGNS